MPLSKYTEQYKYHGIAISIILLYVAPIFILGENSYFRIGDNLDSNVVWYKLLIDSHAIFASPNTIIPTIMGGLPRISFGSEFDFLLWLNKWFGPIYGYALNQLFMRLTAYIGMYLLLKRYLLEGWNVERYYIYIISSGVSLTFSLLPFWPSGGLSVAGLPLVTYLFLNILNDKDKWYDWLILCLIPFYTSFVLVYFFYLMLASFAWVYMVMKYKKFYTKFLVAISLMTIIYLIVNYRLVTGMLLPSDFVSHRQEMSIAKAMHFHMQSLQDYLNAVFEYIINGHHAHIATFHKYVIGFSLALALMLSSIARDKKSLKILSFYLVLIVIFSFIFKLWYFPPFDQVKTSVPILKQFNMGRIVWINPLLWYIVFAFSLLFIIKYVKYKKLIPFILMTFITTQSIYLFSKSDFWQVYRSGQPTFKQFYDTELFDRVKNILNKHTKRYKVACLGFYPAIAQYNGIATIGGYSPNYPLQYKHSFRKIIEKTLNNNPEMKRQFDYWGSYCYLQVTSLKNTFMGNRPKNIVIDASELNFKQMKKLGAKYILSTYELKHNQNLKFMAKVESPNKFWTIYIYKIL
ncbi:DUF6044 family protein [Hydrogenimonas cancrithermarum]|uniref:DUF6044 family protein n=1 Tax=Hydrogenimonas cancrithermarum TaxID=2993563 RepID=UPI002572E75A|nr:DUF6044 family protein [Hydrogenimonas cancrithermarum]